MTLTPGWASVIIGVIALVSGGIAFWLRGVDTAQERVMTEMKTTIKDQEKRLAGIERNYISRADHAQFKMELMNAVKEIGERLTHGMDKIESLVERIAKMEGHRG